MCLQEVLRNLDTRPHFRFLLKHKACFVTVVTKLFRPSITVCQLPRRSTSPINLLGMLGPPRFYVARGDRVGESTPTISLVPREWTPDTLGASSSAGGPVRLSPGPGASLPLAIEYDHSVAHIPDSSYTGHVIMYSSHSKMIIMERADSIQQKLHVPSLCASQANFQRCQFAYLQPT